MTTRIRTKPFYHGFRAKAKGWTPGTIITTSLLRYLITEIPNDLKLLGILVAAKTVEGWKNTNRGPDRVEEINLDVGHWQIFEPPPHAFDYIIRKAIANK